MRSMRATLPVSGALLLASGLRPRARAGTRLLSAVARSEVVAPQNVLALDRAGLEDLLTSWGEPRYRAKQVHDWVYTKGQTEFALMTTLPKQLRERLEREATVGSMSVALEQCSRDGTRKRLWKLHDDHLIESVLMAYDDGRRTACISSQVGCAMGCTFCATGQMGYRRQLSAGEIFEQAAHLAAELRAKDERLSNVVFMGMGEPFRNFDAVVDAARRISKQLGIGARHITISTVGLAPEIRRFADVCASESLELKLAISLHQSTDAARGAIMPVNRKYDLATLLDACEYYVKVTRRRISFEWALIAGENDSVDEARRLAKMLKPLRGKAHINVIPLNPTRGYEGLPSAQSARFVAELNLAGVPATVRTRRGIDIDAGCGQLADAASKERREAQREAAAAGGD